MRVLRQAALGAILLGSLSACGYSTGDRVVSGGLLGAGGGAAVGALAGNPGAGAAAGALAGAAVGGLTSPNSVNLGRPAWR
ncbi:YMGG-like glycine zipper-containing protein [Roseococcus sp. YIM B11640]|uniref:YMGG-like glycine zipper-containing protein n=1 Tax=Roseococcus sp. YIM B11640 TaxID=3133973 RepID=UPI003C7E0865